MGLLWDWYHLYTIKALEMSKATFLCISKNVYFYDKFSMCFHANILWLKFSHPSVWQISVEIKTMSPLRQTLEKNCRSMKPYAGTKLNFCVPCLHRKGHGMRKSVGRPVSRKFLYFSSCYPSSLILPLLLLHLTWTQIFKFQKPWIICIFLGIM